jgi:hypothetical protein
MGAGTVLVFSAAYLAAVFTPSDRLVWQRTLSTVDLRMRIDSGPQLAPGPIDRDGTVGPFRPWQGPALPGPGILFEPPVFVDRSLDG